MDEMHRHGEVGPAALRAGLSPNTARKYLRAGRLPSELAAPRTWRTRADPFAADWAELRARLVDAPDLEATTLFEDLLRRKPDGYTPGQVRTLQRRLKQWRAQEGPPKRIFFPQVHRPGEAMQTDFTWASALGITIGGEPFPHLLCHPVLPYSNWEWATICQSESLAALRRGVQTALVRLGRAPTTTRRTTPRPRPTICGRASAATHGAGPGGILPAGPLLLRIVEVAHLSTRRPRG